MQFKMVFIAFIFYLIQGISIAGESRTLFSVDVDRQTPSPSVQREGLEALLNKLSPGEYDAANPEFIKAQPKDYIKSLEKTGANQYRLSFYPERIKRLFEKAEQGIWLSPRPQTTVLLVVPRGKLNDSHELAVPTRDWQLIKALTLAGKKKGLNLYFPEYDQKTMIKINASINATLFNSTDFTVYINRVPNQAYLYIYLQSFPDQYFFDLRISYQDECFLLTDGPRIETPRNDTILATKVIEKYSKLLFKHYKEYPNPSHSVWVNIDNIHSVATFDKIEQTLQSIPGVSRISLNSVTEDSVLYTLHINIPDAFLDRRLRHLYMPLQINWIDNIYYYRFIS